MADRFIFSYVDEDHNGLFRDMTSEKAKGIIDFLPSHKNMKSGIGQKIEKAMLSYRLNIRFRVPFTSVFCNLDNYPYNKESVYHLILPTTSISKMSIDYLKGFRTRHKNAKLYALVTDSMHADSSHMNLVRDKLLDPVWTEVLTFDKYDAEKYGFKWYGYIYSTFDDVTPDAKESELYYIGTNKGNRGEKVLDIYEFLKHGGVDIRFDVASKEKNTRNSLQYMEKWISYPEVVSRVKSTNCILEILQEGQEMQSMRYSEAVAYNKKLLSNNRHLSEVPYYDPRYMRYFEKPEDIDVEWVKKAEDVEYGYHGEFSPLKIVDFIRKLSE